MLAKKKPFAFLYPCVTTSARHVSTAPQAQLTPAAPSSDERRGGRRRAERRYAVGRRAVHGAGRHPSMRDARLHDDGPVRGHDREVALVEDVAHRAQAGRVVRALGLERHLAEEHEAAAAAPRALALARVRVAVNCTHGVAQNDRADVGARGAHRTIGCRGVVAMKALKRPGGLLKRPCVVATVAKRVPGGRTLVTSWRGSTSLSK